MPSGGEGMRMSDQSEDKKSSTLSEKALKWIPILAVIGGSIFTWTQFFADETRKSFSIEMDVSAAVGDPFGTPKMAPITLDTSLKNIGDKGLFIVGAFALLEEEAFPDIEEPIPDLGTVGGLGVQFTKARGARKLLEATAFEFFTPFYWLESSETQSNQVVFLVPTDKDRLFAYKIQYHLAKRCNGIYPFETCYNFTIEESWPLGDEEVCRDKTGAPLDPFDRNYEAIYVGLDTLCVRYARQVVNGDGTWEAVTGALLADEHGFINYDRNGLVLYRADAKIGD
jgi:hypothetical protein